MNYKFLSTGGCGDSWIVFLKILEIIRKDLDLFDYKVNVEWLHIESHNHIKEACEQLYGDKSWLNFTFLEDPDYVQNVKSGKWNEYTSLSTSMNGFCSLHGQTQPLNEPFWYEDIVRDEPKYDVCIQVSGGAKNNRSWKFEPKTLCQILKNKGMKVVLVGNDKKYQDLNDENNLIGKISLLDTLSVVRKSDLFIGLSGFLNYYACSVAVPNVHLIESEEHEKRYYHPLWKDFAYGIEYPSIKAVLDVIREKNGH